MGQYEGSWSGLRKYLEKEMVAPCLNGRIRFDCTAYTGMDGCRVFRLFVDDQEVKRFSLETVNSYFIAKGLKEKPSHLCGSEAYWDGFGSLLDEISLHNRTEYTDAEFCEALAQYRSQDIQKSVHSENALVVMFALLDRRVGKRTLKEISGWIGSQPAWIQKLYQLRIKADVLIVQPLDDGTAGQG